jgi:hypothetical protein
VLVIDRVVFTAQEEINQVGCLHHKHAFVLQQRRRAAHEPADVVHMGQHVVRMHHHRRSALVAQFPADALAEELVDRRHTGLIGHRGKVRCRFDAQHVAKTGSLVGF